MNYQLFVKFDANTFIPNKNHHFDNFVSLTLLLSRSPSVGFYVDQGKVIAVNNPDYNVERTEVISCGKQTEFGLNLSKRD